MSKIPDFIIIGAQKCGTTSLYRMMLQHPQILPHKKVKSTSLYVEVHFFDEYYDKGIEWYKSLFTEKKNTITGEKTPCYLFHDIVPERIKKDCPNTKFIVVLRNPIERAYSHFMMNYNYYKKQSLKKLKEIEGVSCSGYNFLEALHLEDIIDKSVFENNKYWSFKRRGQYVNQLERWFKYFPKNQFLIIDSTELAINPQKILNKVFRFLHIKSYEITPVKVNKGRYYTNLAPEVEQKLKKYYKPYNEKLYKLLNRNFRWE